MSETPPSLGGVLRYLVLLLTLTLGLVACASPSPEPFPPAPVPAPTATATATANSPDRPDLPIPEDVPGAQPAPAGTSASGYVEQKIRWESCTRRNRTFDCATALAPLDWSRPEDAAISLFLLRVRATKWPKRGTIFVNPGGPGEPGSGLAARFQRKGLEHYDIVGWDPRGTGQSTAVRCGDGPSMDAFFEVDTSPDDEAERTALIEASEQFGKECLARSGRLLEHISTVDTVYDLDLLRRLVGDEKLHFFGYSYGTNIGSRYAHMFPDRVGRVALDGAVRVSETEEVIQAVGFERSLFAFADWCAEQQCRLGRDRPQVVSAITGFFDRVDREPIPVGDRMLTQSQAVTGVVVMLYGATDEYRMLLSALERAIDGDGALLLQLADFYNSRSSDGSYATRQAAFTAIRCLDKPDEGLAVADERAARQNEKAPILGPYFGPDYSCPTWSVPPRPAEPPVTAKGAAPILVIGTTGDSATPYEFAVGMAQQLESGVLLTYDGPGHGAYGGNSECVDQAVVAYFTAEPRTDDHTC